ncbi:MAG: protein kinase [Myxococcota bacterium]
MGADALIGRTIGGKIRIVRLLGTGGMGRVYRATHAGLNKDIAVKVLRPDLLSDPERVRRFRIEAQSASRLEHPATIRIYDFGEDGPDHLLFIAMELVEGTGLDQVLVQDGALKPERAVRIMVQILGALAEAHDAGIIHRDLKPANVLLQKRADDDGVLRDQVKVCDFGLAKLIGAPESEPHATRVGTYLGTPAFMSPEQARGQTLDTRSDLYSAGVMLYQMLTGHIPFSGDSPLDLMVKHITEPAPRASSSAPNLSPILDDIVDWSLAKDVNKRCPSARQMRKALLGFLEANREPSVDSTIVSGPPLNVPPAMAASSPEGKSVIVLPLLDLSPQPQAYFADAMTEAVIMAIAKKKSMKVISRTSSMQYKGRAPSVADLVRELGVTHVLEGSVARHDPRVRVNMALVDAREDAPIWSETYERAAEDVLGVERALATLVADAIEVELSLKAPSASAVPAPSPSVSANAYDAVLRGRMELLARTPASIRRAIEQFRRGQSFDPKSPLPLAGLADAYNLLSSYNLLPPTLANGRALEAAQAALELDPENVEAKTAAAFAVEYRYSDLEGAERLFKEAIALNPSYAQAHQWYAELLAATGRFDEAEKEAKESRGLDPLSPLTDGTLSLIYYLSRRFEQAAEVAERAAARHPTSFVLYPVWGWALTHLERYDAAVERLEKARELSGGYLGMDAALAHTLALAGLHSRAEEIVKSLRARERTEYVPAFYFGMIAAALGDYDAAFVELFRARDEGTSHLVFAKVDANFDCLRADDRFVDLVGKPLSA